MHYIEEEKYQNENRWCKAMQDMDGILVEISNFTFQSWYGNESCSWKNAEPCFKNTDKIIQGTHCIKIIESMKVGFFY